MSHRFLERKIPIVNLAEINFVHSCTVFYFLIERVRGDWICGTIRPTTQLLKLILNPIR